MRNLLSTSKKSAFWIYGMHAVQAALLNPKRMCYQLLYLEEHHLNSLKLPENKKLNLLKASRQDFLTLFSPDSVHQGLALQISSLKEFHLEEILNLEEKKNITLVTLDQVTDPQNLGAIVRSATAFGIHALIVQDRHSPTDQNPNLYKTASGALELLPLIRVTNISRALLQIQEAGFWNLGFDETGTQSITQCNLAGKINLVLGSEGKGLRRLTKDSCDILTHLPTSPFFKTLNVANAAAIAFYETYRQREALEKK